MRCWMECHVSDVHHSECIQTFSNTDQILMDLFTCLPGLPSEGEICGMGGIVEENLKCTAQQPLSWTPGALVCLPCSLQGGTAICMQGLRPSLHRANPRARFSHSNNCSSLDSDIPSISFLFCLPCKIYSACRALDPRIWQLRPMPSRAQVISIICQPA
jgi:hypothetical protein